jgi:hypothetical protein
MPILVAAPAGSLLRKPQAARERDASGGVAAGSAGLAEISSASEVVALS